MHRTQASTQQKGMFRSVAWQPGYLVTVHQYAENLPTLPIFEAIFNFRKAICGSRKSKCAKDFPIFDKQVWSKHYQEKC